MKRFFTTLIPLTALIACGGGAGTASDNPPDVEGSYVCTDGCDGPSCIFDSIVTVTQNGDDIIVSSAVFGDAIGTINNDGEFHVESDTTDCDGQIVDDVTVADCTAEGTDCQQVTFER